MKDHWKEISLALIIIAATLYLLLQVKGKILSPSTDLRDAPQTQIQSQPACQQETFTIHDDWLAPKIKPGDKLIATTNWRECGLTLKRNAIVFYKVSPAHEPVARIVAAAPGDTFELQQPPQKNFWHIEINGDLYMQPEGVQGPGSPQKPYHFGSHAPPSLKIYFQAHAGKLDSTSVVLLSARSPGDQDSGSLGVLSTSDIIAIVDPR